MSNETVSLWNLWPDFQSIVQGSMSTASGINAHFVVFFWVIAGGIFLYLFYQTLRSYRQVMFYQNLLNDLTHRDVAQQRQILIDEALTHQKFGQLWKRFDDTLVNSADDSTLYTTSDAGSFFNAAILIKGLANNPAVAAISALLILLGLVGTFLGLQTMMNATELADDSAAFTLWLTINNVSGWTSISFMTSVWGVLTGLTLYSVALGLHKLACRWVNNLEDRINYLFPQITTQQSLVSISDHLIGISDLSQANSHTLEHVEESIEQQLNKSVKRTKIAINMELKKCLKETLEPATQKFADNLNTDSQHALEYLAKKYSDQHDEAGRAHQETLKNVSESVPKAADQIRKIITRLSATEKKLSKSAELRANERQTELQSRLQEVVSQNKSAVDNVQVVIMGQIAKQDEIYQEKLDAVEASAKEQQSDLESRLQAISSESMVAIENRIAAVMDQIAALGQIDQTKLDAAADSVSTLSNNQSNLTMRVQDLMMRQDHDFQTLQNCVQLIVDELGNTEDLTQSDVG